MAEKEDLQSVEKSLFADANIEDNTESLGLKPEPSAEPNKEHLVLKLDIGGFKQKAKKTMFWLVISLLAISFFYNPLYQYFPWNNGIADSGITGSVVAELPSEDAVNENTEPQETTKETVEEKDTPSLLADKTDENVSEEQTSKDEDTSSNVSETKEEKPEEKTPSTLETLVRLDSS